jgi:hypothetical protein
MNSLPGTLNVKWSYDQRVPSHAAQEWQSPFYRCNIPILSGIVDCIHLLLFPALISHRGKN